MCVQQLLLLRLAFSNSQQSTHHIGSSMVSYCVGSRAFKCWFVWDCIPPPSPIIIYSILVSGVVTVLHVCSHLNSFFWVSCYFIFLYFNGFHYYHYCHHYFTLVYFDQPPLKVFQCDCMVPMFVLPYFILFIPLLEQGLVAGLWILLGAWLIPSCWPGLSCWPSVGLFWASDLHLQ